jgi:hypothetical protein
MVRRTCATIERVAGQRVLSWRNHAYYVDSNTPRVLAQAGIRVWSDEVQLERLGPYSHRSGLTSLPINTTPDHENLYHGSQTVETIPVSRRSRYNSPRAWREEVLQQAESIIAKGGVATILAHPLCMKVVDDWQTFAHVCSSLSSYPNA